MRQTYRLNARALAGITKPGRYADGHLLFLQVRSNGRSWVMRYHAPGGRVRELGLGSAATVSLAEAREARDRFYAKLRTGTDPLADKKASKTQAKRAATTFGEVAKEYLDKSLTRLKNEKHRWQWRQTLEKHAATIWGKSVAEITTDDVYQCIDPIWDATPETAARTRGRIQKVLAAARAHGLYSGENPARWEFLEPLFENRAKPAEEHHAALPYADAPKFMVELRALQSVSARALEFLILTAARSGEVRGVTWSEIDVKNKKWVVPAGRMKVKDGGPHEVPLTDRAVEILKSMKHGKPRDLVFVNTKTGKMLSDTALLMCLRGLRPGYTSHGFRSTFSDWIGDETDYPRDLREFALAHKIPDAVERAYRHKTGFEKRRKMMADWSNFLASNHRP